MSKDTHPTEKVGRNPKLETKSQPKKVEVKDASVAEKPKAKPQKKPTNFKDYPKLTWAWFMGLNRNTKLACALALILVLVGITTIALSGGDENQEFASEEVVEVDDSTPKMGVAITVRQGTLEAKDEEGNWVEAEEELQPQEGDELRTVGAASRAVLTFDDGSALRLDGNSEVIVESLSVDRIVINHKEGYTYSRVVASADRDYIVESSDAQYEAQGTAFKTAASGDEQSVEVYQSTVHETSTNEKPTEGEKLTIKNFAQPSKDGKIEKLDIEAVKQDQFMLWNKELDSQDENFKNDLGFLKDFDGPEINITSHQEGQTVLLEPNATEGTIELAGTTEKGAKLTVQSKSQGGSSPVEVGVGGSGEFTTPVLTAPLGSSVFEFVSKDRAGNATTKNIRINFQRKSAPVGGSGSVNLSVDYDNGDDKVEAMWSISGSLDASDGYKLVYSKSQNPTYPSDNPNFVNGTSTSIKGNKFSSGESYYFRVCIYNSKDNKCSNYSNQVKVDIP